MVYLLNSVFKFVMKIIFFYINYSSSLVVNNYMIYQKLNLNNIQTTYYSL